MRVSKLGLLRLVVKDCESKYYFVVCGIKVHSGSVVKSSEVTREFRGQNVFKEGRVVTP